mmetsp:Transcript_558/g.1308  ORF Transcript_558/g.1308 Transcript_558/m.1308 type:complete len:82 (+) Transcript_558:171-416(+)
MRWTLGSSQQKCIVLTSCHQNYQEKIDPVARVFSNCIGGKNRENAPPPATLKISNNRQSVPTHNQSDPDPQSPTSWGYHHL